MGGDSHFHNDHSTNGRGATDQGNHSLPLPIARVLAYSPEWLEANRKLGFNPNPNAWRSRIPAPTAKQSEQGDSKRDRADYTTTTNGSSQSQVVHRSVVRVWEEAEPPPRPFVIEGLIPDRAVTSLYGDGGQGKSYLALWLCCHVVRGIPFADRQVAKHTVLYLDGELDKEEFVHRAYQIARGMGSDAPPFGLHYLQLPGPLTDARVQTFVSAVRDEIGATFCVLDSLTMSTFGSDPKEAPDVIRVIKYLETLGTVLAIDHIGKPPIGVTNLSHFRQFGSAFKWHGERSIIQLIKAEGGGLQLLHKKTNFSALSKPICLSLKFEENSVCLGTITADAPEMAGIDEHLPPMECVYRALASFGTGGTKPEKLVDDLKPMNVKTIRNHLTTLKRASRAESVDGVWCAL